MESAPLVTIIAVSLAIVVVAAFLITVVYQLYIVNSRLDIILGVVGDVIEKTDGIDVIAGEIATDLAAGQQAIDSSVQRLESRFGPAATPSDSREPAGIGSSSPDTAPPTSGYRNY